MQFDQLLNTHQAHFRSHITKSYQWRVEQLKALKALVVENEQAIADALSQDLSKPFQETWITEISYVSHDVDYILKRLKSWMKPRRVSTPIVAQPGRSYVKAEPQGVALIMSAWNYPFQLMMAPLAANIATGNCAILKPSELAPNISKLITQLIPKYLDNKAFSVVEGAVEETTELLKLKFDHIMYTGNGMVAKIIMTAAAKHLTPVTLELGGKSPVFVDSSANIDVTAERIAWGKWMNAGQTCIAPDYILTTNDMVAPLTKAIENQIEKMFSSDPKSSKDYGTIINERHTKRIASYLENTEITYGGEVDIENKYIQPTIVVNPSLTSPVMTDEIFGPILPIISVNNFEQAKNFVLDRDKPLSAYIFTKQSNQEKEWVNEISSGSQCVNDVIMFNAVTELPFGGVGPSGMGQYSGKAGFDNFSHLKSVLKRPFLKDLSIRFAPYEDWKLKVLKWLR